MSAANVSNPHALCPESADTTGQDGLGTIAELELAILNQLCAPGWTLASNSGTSSAAEVFWAIGLRPGDRVVVPAFGFRSTYTTLLPLGVIPQFVDVDPVHGHASVETLLDACTEGTKGVVWTHLWGTITPLASLRTFLVSRGCLLVEDHSHSLASAGALHRVGSNSDAAFASLNAYKPLGATEAGVAWFAERKAYERALAYGHSGSRARREITDTSLQALARVGMGVKHRITVPAADIALAKVHAVGAIRKRRWAAACDLVAALGRDAPLTPLFDPDAPEPTAFHHIPFTLRDDLAWRPGASAAALRSLASLGVPVVIGSATSTMPLDPGVRALAGEFPHLPAQWPHGDRWPGSVAYADRLVLIAPEELSRRDIAVDASLIVNYVHTACESRSQGRAT